MARKQRRWSVAEDLILAQEVKSQCIEVGNVRDWSRIAAKIPGRDNKDCRKRFYNQVTGGLKKGLWSSDEDDRLRSLVKEVGLSWAEVARSMVNRSAEQCSKRWKHHLDPLLDHSPWSDEENTRLLIGVEYHGTVWSKIQQLHFPGRSTNNIKNTYALLKHRGAELPKDAQNCCTSDASTATPGSNSSSDANASSSTPLSESKELNVVNTPDTDLDMDDFDLSTVFDFSSEELTLLSQLEGAEGWSAESTQAPPTPQYPFQYSIGGSELSHVGNPDINAFVGHYGTQSMGIPTATGEFTAGIPEHIPGASTNIIDPSAGYIPTTMPFGEAMDISTTSNGQGLPENISRTYITIDDVDPSVLTAVMDILVRKRAKVRFEMRQE